MEYRLVAVVLRAKADAAVPAELPPDWPVGVVAETVTMFTLADRAGVQVPDSVTVEALVLAVIWKPLASFDETVSPLLAVPVGVPLEGSMLELTVAVPVETMATALATVNVTFCVAVVDASAVCAPKRVVARTIPAIQRDFKLITASISFHAGAFDAHADAGGIGQFGQNLSAGTAYKWRGDA